MTSWIPSVTQEWGGRPVARVLAAASPRQRVVLAGRISEVRVTQRNGPGLEAVLDDGTASITLRWLGRDHIAGIEPGAFLRAEGTVLEERGRRVVLNPLYRFDRPAGYCSNS